MTPSNLIVFAIFVILLNPIPTQVDGQKEQSDIIEALLTLQKALGGKTNTWDRSTAPCSWKGIRCVEGEVTEIRLPGGSLIGVIPNGVFGSLSSLRALSIHDNAIVGPLPSDLASCVQLRYLYLHRNGFEGDISVLGSLKKLINLDISQNKFSSDDVSTIGSLRDLANLNLGSNEFSGSIPESFSELQNLRSLLLENNDFSGVIPDLDLRNLKSFNVSYNNLTGSVPNKLRSFPETSFLGMSSLCGGSLQSCEDEKEKKTDKLSIKQLLGIIIPCIIFLLILLFLLLFCCLRRRRASQAKETDLEASSATTTAARRSVNSNASTGSASSKVLVFFDPDPIKKFDLEELLRASAEVLGKGTFGTTYKALLEQGFTVAVKRLRSVDVSDATAFRSKIESLGKMVHPNLVPLRAFYNGREETLFIYDFMYVGSLSARLHGTRGSGRIPFNWEARLEVAIGSACGIAYIHSTGETTSHGNIKTSNILLSEECSAFVSDHGLNQFVSDSSAPSRVPGYQAAEVTDTRRVSQKADVYSFGIVLLELLTCKAPVMNDECRDLPRWVRSMKREEWFNEVFDSELLRDHAMEDEMIVLLEIGLDCTEQHPDKRPVMSDVLRRIQDIRNATVSPPY